jgi:hypothetical protein
MDQRGAADQAIEEFGGVSVNESEGSGDIDDFASVVDESGEVEAEDLVSL